MTEKKQDDATSETREEAVKKDLELPEKEAVDVKGGSDLNILHSTDKPTPIIF